MSASPSAVAVAAEPTRLQNLRLAVARALLSAHGLDAYALLTTDRALAQAPDLAQGAEAVVVGEAEEDAVGRAGRVGGAVEREEGA